MIVDYEHITEDQIEEHICEIDWVKIPIERITEKIIDKFSNDFVFLKARLTIDKLLKESICCRAKNTTSRYMGESPTSIIIYSHEKIFITEKELIYSNKWLFNLNLNTGKIQFNFSLLREIFNMEDRIFNDIKETENERIFLERILDDYFSFLNLKIVFTVI